VSFFAPFQTLESAEKLLFFLPETDARKLTPIADTSRTIGNKTLVWRTECGPQKAHITNSELEHRQFAELRSA